ncbi:MAG TPA: DUF2514 family protein, partial [Comamonas sp.]
VAGYGYQRGYSKADGRWQAKWQERDLLDAQATAQRQAEERAKEQQRQIAINEIASNAQANIEQAQRDAATAARTADSLRAAIDQAAGRLADSEASHNACTADASKARADAARVLADVLKRADERAGKLAAYADRARVAGLACEAAYDAVSETKEK